MDAICQLGCCACRVMGITGVPAEPHHLLSGGRRIGHLHTIPLCDLHHRSHVNDGVIVSRHPWRRAFEKAYGTEQQLLEQTRELVQRREVVASRGETEAMSQ
jgi:hypothetical protein